MAGLCSVDKDFPLHLWDRLLPQAEITLNLLRGSRVNPKLLAWAQIGGTFDFNRTPIAPPGTRVVVQHREKHGPHMGLTAGTLARLLIPTVAIPSLVGSISIGVWRDSSRNIARLRRIALARWS